MNNILFFFFSNIQIVSQKLADANEKILADVKLSLVVRFFHEMCFFFPCRSDSLPQLPVLQRSNTFTDMRPMQRRTIRYPKSEEYVHDHSMFMVSGIYISNVPYTQLIYCMKLF